MNIDEKIKIQTKCLFKHIIERETGIIFNYTDYEMCVSRNLFRTFKEIAYDLHLESLKYKENIRCSLLNMNIENFNSEESLGNSLQLLFCTVFAEKISISLIYSVGILLAVICEIFPINPEMLLDVSIEILFDINVIRWLKDHGSYEEFEKDNICRRSYIFDFMSELFNHFNFLVNEIISLFANM